MSVFIAYAQTLKKGKEQKLKINNMNLRIAEAVIETTDGHYFPIFRLFVIPESGEYNDANVLAELTHAAFEQYPNCYIHSFKMHDNIVTD